MLPHLLRDTSLCSIVVLILLLVGAPGAEGYNIIPNEVLVMLQCCLHAIYLKHLRQGCFPVAIVERFALW